MSDVPIRFRPRGRPASFAPAAALAAALAAVSGACGGAAPVDEPVVRDSAGITVVENAPGAAARVPRWSVGPDPALRIGVVEGDPAYQFHLLRAGATLPDGRVVVVDGGSDQVRIFGREGRIVATQGRPGEGPGEYRRPRAVWVLPGDTVAVYDPGLSRVTLLAGDSLALVRVVAVDGEFANPELAGTIRDGRGFVVVDRRYAFEGPLEPQYAHVWTFGLDEYAPADPVLQVVHGEMASFPLDGRTRYAAPVFGAQGAVVAGGDALVYGRGDRYALQVHDPAGTLRRIIRWHGPDRTIDPREVSAWIDTMVARSTPERRASSRSYIEARPVAERKPAHHRMLFDMAGRLWVSRWTPWPDQRWTEWWIFDADGRMVATAEVPRRVFVLALGETEVLATTTDALDVEYLVLLPIRRGGEPGGGA